MNTSRKESVIQISILDIQKRLLPRAYELRDRLQAGQAAESYDLEFLETLHKAIQNLHILSTDSPEHHLFIGNLVQLYSALISMALKNSED
ncbi:hypothetical protein ACMXYR_01595 [Neptuniibacter sp. QD29_5]|uniref:hypothetical protein n=1 Tax=unclassified Neptuniibacter TaxID=2630693 RepID=UPI0039F61F76